MPDFLLEIRCEELPAGYLEPALAQLRRDFRALVKESGLTSGGVVVDGTPRRIVLAAKKLPERTAKRELEIPGPSEKVAFKDSRPTPAAQGFARKHGLKADELVLRDTPKGRYCFALVSDPGSSTIEILAQALPGIIAGLSFPKSMRWVSREHTFARPVRNLAALLGTEVVGFEYAGIRSGRTVSGHPFLAPSRSKLQMRISILTRACSKTSSSSSRLKKERGSCEKK